MNIVISGPGGVGKGTLVNRLLEVEPNIWLSRSWTTRARRPAESADAYVFTDEETFRRKIAEGGFLEWVEFLDYLQGTPVPEPPPGCHVLFEIDVNGAEAIRSADPYALLIFIDAPDPEEQGRRMRERGDPEEVIRARLAHGEEERAAARRLAMAIVVNDDLDRAVDEVRSLIAAHR